MFFSTELLSRRDGGFGLLWLAATLGPKSSFSKLPKRSVLNADIAQLCELIAQPQEPLSLRLSSNLMVGAARVYRVKHDIFFADVNSCFVNLKKAVQDIRAAASTAALEMNNPVARLDALNVALDPGMGRAALDIDFLAPSWDEWIARAVEDLDLDIDDSEDYDPRARKSNSRAAAAKRTKQQSVPATPGAHTLDEHHLHLLHTSLDGSSSSQNAGSFQLPADMSNDDLLFDGGGLGNMDLDLGLDLGEGWEFPTQATIAENSFPLNDHRPPMDEDFPPIDFGGQGDAGFMMDVDMQHPDEQPNPTARAGGHGRKRTRAEAAEKDNEDPDADFAPHPRSILVTPSRTEEISDKASPPPVQARKKKLVRLLLDVRTELTDAEMKHAREKYVEEQNKLRLAEEAKKQEKDMMRRIDEMMWLPPPTFRAPELLEFWHNSFKVQVEARSGAIHVDRGGHDLEHGHAKRRRVNGQGAAGDIGPTPDAGPTMLDGEDFMMNDFGGIDFDTQHLDRIRSSATPEMARRGSRPPSVTGSGLGVPDLPADLELARGQHANESQVVSLFPWDNAGFASSSVAGGAASGLRTPSVKEGDATRLSRSRSVLSGSPALRASVGQGSLRGLSDAGGPVALDEFQLDLDVEGMDDGLGASHNQTGQSQSQSQSASQTLAALEKSSFKFLEYAKAMQLNVRRDPRAGGSRSVMFDDILPKETSNRDVAASGFYHCLLLATKDLVRLEQPEPFGPIKISIL